MALGNANSSAQSRGKNKAVKVRRAKEVVTARGYTSFTSSTVQSKNACSYSGAVNQTYYHNGSSSLPRVNDKVYSRPRASDRYSLNTGHYKVDAGGGRYKNVNVNSSGVVTRVDNC